MKNYLLLASIVLMLSACSKNEQKQSEELSLLALENMNYGWSSEYNVETNHIDITGPWGARGWGFGEENDTTTYADFSKYDRVIINLSGIEGPVTKLNLIVRYTIDGCESRDLCTIVNGETTMRLKLNEKMKGKVKSIFLMCDTVCQMNITSAYFDTEHTYGEPKQLNMSNIGIISADQFEGYSDNAMVNFTFETKGELMGVNQYGDMVDMTGWAIGIICSAADIIGGDLPTRSIVLRNLGKQVYSCELGDIRYLLSLKDDDGECGIYWTVWAVGGVTEANVINTTIAEVIE